MATRYPCRPRLESLERRDCPSTYRIAPWMPLASVAALPLVAGDTVELRAGATYHGSLVFDVPVTLTRYGYGADPVIDAGTATAVEFDGCGGTVSGLFLQGNYAPLDPNAYETALDLGPNTGILFRNDVADARTATGVSVTGVTIHNFNTGVAVWGRFDQVEIGWLNIQGGELAGIALFPGEGQTEQYTTTNVTINNVAVYGVTGFSTTAPGGNGDGIEWSRVDGITVDACIVDSCGSMGQSTIGIGCDHSNHVVVQNCEVYRQSSGNGLYDGDGIDLDYATYNGTILNNVVDSCGGAGILVGPVGGGDVISGNTISNINLDGNGYPTVAVWGWVPTVTMDGVPAGSFDATWKP